MKLGIQAALWILSVFFAYKIYDAISGPINFNQVKNERYAVVNDRLKDIRTAQIAHKDASLCAICAVLISFNLSFTTAYLSFFT